MVQNGTTTTSYSYDSHDKLTSAGSKSYGYDSNGNCTSVTVGSSVTSISYDIENRVIGITYPSSATNSFAYNGEGLRTQKVDSTGTQNYVTDGSSPGSPLLKDGNAVYTPGVSEHRGSTSKFYHGDALGSTRGITDSSQSVTDSQLFDAFGNTVSRTGTTPTPFGFVGKAQYQSDSDSGLQLLGHRYYDPSIGRFLSSDPAKDGTNWYAYGHNNPLKSIDPKGLSSWGVGLGILAGIGTAAAITAGILSAPIWAPVAVGVGVAFIGSMLIDNQDPQTASVSAVGAGLAVLGIQGATGIGTRPTPYPPNDGFVQGTRQPITLQPGEQYWRYGHLGGRFIAPVGTPPEAISLPPGNSGLQNGPTLIEITGPIDAEIGIAAPWTFPNGQVGIGGGTQILLPNPINQSPITVR